MEPLLFNLFINDLTYFVNDAKLRLYADDMTPYLSHPNQYALESRSQNKFNLRPSLSFKPTIEPAIVSTVSPRPTLYTFLAKSVIKKRAGTHKFCVACVDSMCVTME